MDDGRFQRGLACAAATVVGGVFVWAGVVKAMRPEIAMPAVRELLPSGMQGVSSVLGAVCALAAIEIAVGLSLVMRRQPMRWGIVAAGLLAVYTGYLGWLLMRPDAPRCGCLGIEVGATARQEHLAGVMRNVGLMLCAVLVMRGAHADAAARSGQATTGGATTGGATSGGATTGEARAAMPVKTA